MQESPVFEFTRVTIAKPHTLSRLSNRNLFSHSLGVRESKTWVLVGRFPLTPLSLAHRWPSSLCALAWPFFCVCLVQSSFYKDTSHVGFGYTHMASCDLDDFFKGTISK